MAGSMFSAVRLARFKADWALAEVDARARASTRLTSDCGVFMA
jgi:hypothetical protein